MIETDRDVFKRIRSSDETGLEIDFLSYAIYAFEKHAWAELCKSQTGSYPTEAEERAWISQITEFRFMFFREEAARLFAGAARAYMAAEIEEQKKAAVRDSILAEVKAAGSWWRQIAIALVTAVLAPLIIGAVIVAALWYDRLMFSATDITRALRPPATAVSP